MTQPRVFMRAAARGKWLSFASPCRVLTTQRIEDVLPLVQEVQDAVEREGLYAAGFISYEAAPAFDPAFPSKGADQFPLLWFGVFRQVNEVATLPCGPGINPPISWCPSVNEEEYGECVAAIQRYIHQGDTYQVNFTYRLRGNTDLEPWDLFTRIVAQDNSPYAAFVDTGTRAICSASPELFLRLEGDQIESRPMKGTAARGLWFEDDCARAAALRDSEKDRAENVMIVDMMRNDLGRIAVPGSVQVKSLFDVERYSTVWQMTSRVCARTEASLEQILCATFPPASITGAPKRRAMQIIAELESAPRRAYTGTIGFLTPGRRAQFNVAIRTILIERATGAAEYGVGGGIVWDSKPAEERQECVTKSKLLNPARRDFDLLETLLWSPAQGYWLLEYHLKRLANSAQYFGFQIELNAIRKKLESVSDEWQSGERRLRLVVSRHGAFHCEAAPLEPVALRFSDISLATAPVDASDVFLYHKTTQRGVYERALKASSGKPDVLLFNPAEEITESTVANVAFEIDGALWTPPLRCGLLPGTCRAWLLERGEIRERVVTIDQGREAKAVYLLNSIRGMQKISLVEAPIHEGRDGAGTSASPRRR